MSKEIYSKESVWTSSHCAKTLKLIKDRMSFLSLMRILYLLLCLPTCQKDPVSSDPLSSSQPFLRETPLRDVVWDGRRDPNSPHSLITARTRTEHAQKRVPWNYAFNSASLKEFQPIIIRRASQLADELEKRALAGETMDIGTFFSFFAYVLYLSLYCYKVLIIILSSGRFDFMGDMA